MLVATTVLLLALTRAEIVERLKAPVITQADGLVQVYADCPEDLRREFQMPIASFAAETVKTLYQGLGKKSVRFRSAGMLIHVGDVRTNLAEVVTRVTTNAERIVTRIYVRSPAFADVARLRLEVIKAFYRSVEGREISEDEAIAAYRHGDPTFRIADERMKLENWLNGTGTSDVEEGLSLMRKIFEPGKASRRDVLIFASRLFLYPPTFDLAFMARFKCLSFREALKFAKIDPTIRIMATLKARELPVFGGGRGEEMFAAADAYCTFLLELGKYEKSESELAALLDDADEKLNIAFERAGN